ARAAGGRGLGLRQKREGGHDSPALAGAHRIHQRPGHHDALQQPARGAGAGRRQAGRELGRCHRRDRAHRGRGAAGRLYSRLERRLVPGKEIRRHLGAGARARRAHGVPDPRGAVREMVAAAVGAARAAVRHLRRARRRLAEGADQRRLFPDRPGDAARPRGEERDPDRRVRGAQARGGPVGVRRRGGSGAPALPPDPDDLARVHPRRAAARVLARRRRRRAHLRGHRRDGRYAGRDLPRDLLRADLLQAPHRPPPDREALERGHQARGGAGAHRPSQAGADAASRAARGGGRMKRLYVLGLLALAGCFNQPKYDRPAVELPPAWKESAPRFAEDGRWWRIYDDSSLNAVIDEALTRNADLLVAAARVDEARALLGEANSFFWPSIDANAAVSRQQVSTRTATSFPGIPREYSNQRATLNVSYELDLFGRLRAGAAAARHELEASEASREAVRLALAAQAAKSYFALRALDEQVDLTRKTVSLREQALDLQRKRLRGGVISEFELRQLEAETAVVRAQLPPLEREREREEVALAVLLGRTPRAVFQDSVAIKVAFEEAPGAPVLPAGMPSELLLRRPDLVEAERVLAANNARACATRALLAASTRSASTRSG